MLSLEERLLNHYRDKGWTIAFAESCTGGDLAARLTKIPGASDVFLGSLVTYHSDWKEKLLHVPATLMAAKGVVSEEVAIAMLKGLMSFSKATVGVSVTGFLKPLGGALWVAIQKMGETPQTSSLFLKGDRIESIHAIGNHIFNIIISL
jgi:PncC family amidohydrolase